MTTATKLTPGASRVAVASIEVGDRFRHFDDAAVDRLVKSIHEIGLIHPIMVRTTGRLVAGRHRLEAYRKLGLEMIPAVVVEFDGDVPEQDLRAQLAEIDENFQTNALCYEERCQHLSRRIQIMRDLGLVTSLTGVRESSDKTLTTAQVAEQIGISRASAFEMLRVVADIPENVREMVRPTEFGNTRSAMLALARASEADQQNVAAAVAADPKRLTTYNKAIKALYPVLKETLPDDDPSYDDDDHPERLNPVRFTGTVTYRIPNPRMRTRGDKVVPREDVPVERTVTYQATAEVLESEEGLLAFAKGVGAAVFNDLKRDGWPIPQ